MQYEIVTSKLEEVVYLENDPASRYDGQEGADEFLEKKVNKLIGEGWKPVGGVSMVIIKSEHNLNWSYVLMSQAMIKE